MPTNILLRLARKAKLPGFLNAARRQSYRSSMRVCVGAVISNGGRLISVGYNQKKTHPLTNTFTLHAEAHAIIACRYNTPRLDGSILWVARDTVNGMPAMAKPCGDCMRLIVAAGIKRVYYTIGEPPYWASFDL